MDSVVVGMEASATRRFSFGGSYCTSEDRPGAERLNSMCGFLGEQGGDPLSRVVTVELGPEEKGGRCWQRRKEGLGRQKTMG